MAAPSQPIRFSKASDLTNSSGFSDSGRVSHTSDWSNSAFRRPLCYTAMLQAQQRFTAMKENHVTETDARTERLDERVSPIGLIARQRTLQLRTIVTILGLQKRDAELAECVAEVFRIAPFEDARKRQLVRGILDRWTVSGLPCCRDWNPDALWRRRR